MNSRRDWKPSPSMVVALIALFVAMVGTAYAAGLKKNSVKSKQIKDGQVLTQDIGDGAVGTADLASGAVTAGKIAAGVIPASGLADGSVTTPKLADGAVTQAKLGAGAVNTAALADGAVNSAKVLDDTLGVADLAPNSVEFSELAADAVDTSALQVNSVDNAAIQDGAVNGAKTAETTLEIPTAWAEVNDADGAGANPTIVDSEGVLGVTDGPGAGTDGFTCYDLVNGFVPDLVLALDKTSGSLDISLAGEAPPVIGCAASDEAQVTATDNSSGGAVSEDIYVAFFSL